MSFHRREFVRLAVGGSLVSAAVMRRGSGLAMIRAVAFDAFPIFDARPVFALAESLFPGRGAELGEVWRARQFEYQWLRAAAGRYEDFWRTTEASLEFAARRLRLDLTPDARSRLMQAYLRLTAWPDVVPALRALRDAGVRLAVLSNMTSGMLEANVRGAGLTDHFEHVLSTDRVRSYKPEPRAYQLAVDAFALPREAIVFAAFAGWDAAGAKWFGYPTVWINRADAPAESLDVEPDASGRDLTALTTFVGASR